MNDWTSQCVTDKYFEYENIIKKSQKHISAMFLSLVYRGPNVVWTYLFLEHVAEYLEKSATKILRRVDCWP